MGIRGKVGQWLGWREFRDVLFVIKFFVVWVRCISINVWGRVWGQGDRVRGLGDYVGGSVGVDCGVWGLRICISYILGFFSFIFFGELDYYLGFLSFLGLFLGQGDGWRRAVMVLGFCFLQRLFMYLFCLLEFMILFMKCVLR